MTAAVEPLARDRVDVWEFRLDLPAPERDRLAETLSADERERAARLREGWIRDRFLAGRGQLRAVLAASLGLSAAALEFRTLEHGKPVLAGPSGAAPASFNLAHSENHALLAVTRERGLGIDIERIRADRSLEDLARRFFSPGEREVLEALPPHERTNAFYVCWTRKEAYLKAHGAGISGGLAGFDVLRRGEPRAALFAHALDPSEPGRWNLHDLAAPEGFAAALAVEGDARIARHVWPP